MKKVLIIISVFILAFTSCESSKFNPDFQVLLKVGNNLSYRYTDIELYDSSTHILYFKTNHPELDIKDPLSFRLLSGGEEVYTGWFWPPYSGSMPNSPYIMTYSLYNDFYYLEIENRFGARPDIRNDPRLIQSLKDHNLLHSGLSVIINSTEINGTQLTFTFTVTNHDKTGLMIIDPDRTGPGLFHYFTNGLSLRTLSQDEVFASNIKPESPTPWNSWKNEWLSEINPGDSRQFSIGYTLVNPLIPGEYNALFEFPGLAFQVSKDQLWQNSRRIWLGDIQAAKRIVVK